jgi:hypothetical protein
VTCAATSWSRCAAVATFDAAVLTGICLYAACSCHEITEWKRPRQHSGVGGPAGPPPPPPPALAVAVMELATVCFLKVRANQASVHWLLRAHPEIGREREKGRKGESSGALQSSGCDTATACHEALLRRRGWQMPGTAHH